ncbi:response regulator transcription factor [Streptomyces sp. B1I3]|uniref:response regulator transcription factor n=1 Tax=Streptomyces sp. B1I3 TaxID=3042264 RepID=UPI0027889E94|nr:response regulator transcription factor [Streptomyces sp. B1I3]MDQ0794839.1 DNA-binding response OmpR family regulator [Streptomyces sp. B1I3]
MAGKTALLAHRGSASHEVPLREAGHAGSAAAPPPVPEAGSRWRVLVVESRPDEAALLTQALQRHGHRARNVGTGKGALEAYQEADLVLLDLELPDLDGLEVCRSIRLVDDKPVIAVTARASELDRVLGLQAGADDYLVKPYGFRELMARMDAVMRRSRPRAVPGAPATAATPGVTSHSGLRVDKERRRATLAGQRLDLTPKEFDLLNLLVSHPGDVLSRERLMREVWAGSWSRRTLDTHVCSLRSKLGSGDWILTVRGVGFQIGSC